MNPGSFGGRARDAFVVFRHGVGVTDCHSQCTHWLRNETGACTGCGGTAGDRKGRPYGGHGGAVGWRATARVAPTEGTVVRWDGGRPQGSPLRGRMHSVKMPRRGGAGDRKGRPYGGEHPPLKCIAEFAACERQNYARGRLGAFWRKIGDFSPGTTKGLSRIGTAPLNR